LSFLVACKDWKEHKQAGVASGMLAPSFPPEMAATKKGERIHTIQARYDTKYHTKGLL
jgi:hypothetical protein